MRIPNGLQSLPSTTEEDGTWTLAEAVNQMKRQRLTRLLTDLDEISEELCGFKRAIELHETPTNGQVLAAYYVAARDAIEDEALADDTITDRQIAARYGAVSRTVLKRR